MNNNAHSNDNAVILGAATGYKPEFIELFLNSIHQTGFTGTVALLINSSQHQVFLDYYRNKNFSFHLSYYFTRIGGFSTSKKISKNIKKTIKYFSNVAVSLDQGLKNDFIYFFALPHVSRFFDYQDYLIAHPNYQYVMLTDTRDVIVQSNPFASQLSGLYLGMEDYRNPIGNDSFHVKWITDVYGKKQLNNLKDKPICCAGVTMGDYQSVLSYLDIMIDEFMSLPYYTMVRSNYDQGIHNKLLYENQFIDTHLCYSFESIISTIGTHPREEITVTDSGQFLNKDGTPATIIHQYDRHPDLQEVLNAKYG